MRAIDKLKEWLENNEDEIDGGVAFDMIYEKVCALSLAAEEAANEAKPTADKGLVGELMEWRKEWSMPANLHGTWAKWMDELDEILSRYSPSDKTEVEPLAVLADRKCNMAVVHNIFKGKEVIRLAYHYDTNASPHFFSEKEAREWLESKESK